MNRKIFFLNPTYLTFKVPGYGKCTGLWCLTTHLQAIMLTVIGYLTEKQSQHRKSTSQRDRKTLPSPKWHSLQVTPLYLFIFFATYRAKQPINHYISHYHTDGERNGQECDTKKKVALYFCFVMQKFERHHVTGNGFCYIFPPTLQKCQHAWLFWPPLALQLEISFKWKAEHFPSIYFYKCTSPLTIVGLWTMVLAESTERACCMCWSLKLCDSDDEILDKVCFLM